ncbi:hypothetical protein Pcaca05_01150 [Pectobacterium carotovorum subsp. carotovorum]|nr:hypothetical protein Pcaca05_01150 [Pectobacterium carotovorum subsp. carotovorum]
MELLEIDKLYLFVFFIIPGFISIKAYQLLYPSSSKDAKDMVVDAIAYSCINYAILGFPIYIIQNNLFTHFSTFDKYIYILAILFIFPVAWVLLWKKIRECAWMQSRAPHPTALPWDYVFGKQKKYWVTVYLKNGKVIAGLYSSDSFTSSAPYPPEIYLEENWILDEDNNLERKVNLTAGIIILRDEISHIEFTNIEVE